MSKDEIIAERRARYEALKASGRAPKALPGPSARPAPPPAQVIRSETVPGGWYWTTRLADGDTLRLQCGDDPSCVTVLAWSAADPSERLNTADTVKVQWTTALAKGRVIFSDMGRVMLSIVEDSCGTHDAVLGGSTPASNARRYGTAGPDGPRNSRDNLRLASLKLGLEVRDLPPAISFFAPVRVGGDGRFRWHADGRAPRDYVDLRAEMDLLLALSNCPHPLDPSPVYAPAPVEAIRFRGPPPRPDDLCRTATDEARRGFNNNAAAG